VWKHLLAELALITLGRLVEEKMDVPCLILGFTSHNVGVVNVAIVVRNGSIRANGRLCGALFFLFIFTTRNIS
jgi:hypothetical protein